MAQIGGNFRPKSAHRSKFPWDGSANPWDGNRNPWDGNRNPWDGNRNPWDGNRNPWDGSTEKPLPAAFPTLKGGRRWPSALTVCHIAHTAWAGKITRFGRKGETPHNALTRLARKGYPPRRDAIHRVSPARGAAPPQYLPHRGGRNVGAGLSLRAFSGGRNAALPIQPRGIPSAAPCSPPCTRG